MFINQTLVAVPGGLRRSHEKPKTNIFDSIRKPPSVAMEKIQNSTAATLDRMAVLQQRYRQHKEAMNSDSSDKSRRTSTTSTIDSNVSHEPGVAPAVVVELSVYCSISSLFYSLTVRPFHLNLSIITTTIIGTQPYGEPTASRRPSPTHLSRLNVIRIT